MKSCIHIIMISLAVFFLTSCELPEGDTSDPALRLVGKWQVDETSSIFKSTNTAYLVTITANTENTSQIWIENFYQLGSGYAVYGNIEVNRLSIPFQTVDGFQVIGSGSISADGKSIIISYEITDGSGEKDSVTAEYLKLN